MLIKITERNFWENESWSIVLDLSKQKASAINYLLGFEKLANAQFEIDYAAAKKERGSFSVGFLGMKSPTPCATSRYKVDFYDSYEKAYPKDKFPNSTCEDMALVNDEGKMCLPSSREKYKSDIIDFDRQISVSKIKSAMITMRDKKQNKLYKSLEDILLKGSKKKAA